MKNLILVSLVMAFSHIGFAADKTYQVTGPVLEVTDSTITIQKGKEKWVLKKDATTKTTGDVKVGSKVTAEYTMTATDIEAKAEKKK
jgi:hypothetical protein